MSATKNRGLALSIGLLGASLCGAPIVSADDTELFVDYGASNAAPPNILFILDTSGSMQALVESQAAYDPATTYTGTCPADRVYWRSDAGDPPTCDSTRWFEAAAFKCAAAFEAFASGAGRLTDRFAQYVATDRRWEPLTTSDPESPVECEDDRGRHGDGSSATRVYAANGDDTKLWSDLPADEISWTGLETQTVYSANYLNWYYGEPVSTSRMQVVKDVARGLAGSINGVNVGLMRYNADDGGSLVHAVSDVAGNRDALLAAIDALSASGRTPMAETLYEAARYFLGLSPEFGTSSVGVVDGLYQTPVTHECQKNYIVYLTDGQPDSDLEAGSLAQTLPSFEAIAGPCEGTGDGACLPELARYLYEADLDPHLPGKQNAVTYTIGFTLDLPLLSTTALNGGGQYYIANDTQSLSRALTNIVTSILETQATFTAPAVSVNSFNRTQHLNDLFVTVFQPSETVHWPGNLKKYRLRGEDGMIVDANGDAAVDDSGFFSPDAQSFWSAEPDGRRVTQGGAASRLPAPAARRVFTYFPENPSSLLFASTNAVRTDNPLLTDTVLGIGDPDQPSLEQVIRFIRGEDVRDIDSDGITTEARNQLGDPLHSQPVSLVYGGTPGSPDIEDAVVFYATNDGFLHAIDASSGVEKWAFVPPEFLDDQVRLLENGTSSAKHYGIDGKLRVQVIGDNDGIIDQASDEEVRLFFGMRRGEHAYYALDVTNPDAPSLLWRLDQAALPDLGQTWSAPTPAKISVGNSPRHVVIFGGGYDPGQDDANEGPDAFGNALYIVDSGTGEVIWHGAPSGGTEDFSDMTYSIPADVKVIDLDGDGYADRMYAADMGGQVWRFDIFNGQPASDLVTGGVFARLGAAGLDSPTAADERRFYYAPDVALASTREGSFLHIGIGSGFRAHPNETENENRFYALRDYRPFKQMTQDEHDSWTPLTEDDLADITDPDDPDAVVEAGSAGWMLRLSLGEKVLAEARTFNNDVYFTSFTPNTSADVGGCEPRLGTNRLYVLSLFDGAPVTNLDESVDDEELTVEDRAVLFRGSIASEVSFLFPSAANPDTCVGDECRPLPVACVDLFCFPTSFGNNPIRTFWRQEHTD